MPRPKMVTEKPKDFKGAILRFFKEIKIFKGLILLSLILSALGSVLSIFTPNILSDLTDEIQKGLKPNISNYEKILELNNSEEISKKLNEILNINLFESTINYIYSLDISDNDKQIFNEFLQNRNIFNLPLSILNNIVSDSEYNNKKISKQDKIDFILAMKEGNNFPNSIVEELFEEKIVDNITISKEDQAKLFSIMYNAASTKNNDTYSIIELIPSSVEELIKTKLNIQKIKRITILLASLYIISAIFNYIESISMTVVSNKFAQVLRSNISMKINKLPLKYFDRNKTGDVLSRITNDVDTLAQSMDQSLSTLVSASTLFIGTTLMMFTTNWIMALTAVLSSLLGFIFMALVLSKSQKYFSIRQKELGNLNGHIEEVYSGLNVVKAYNGKKEMDSKFDELNQKLYEANRKSRFLSGLMMPMMGFIGNLGYVAVCIVGAILVEKEIITFGVIVAFITYVRLFTSPLSQIGQSMTSLQTTAAASERVFEFLDEEELEDETNITKKIINDKAKGNIEFKNVTFTYDGNVTPTIKNFSAKVTSGQKIAIVGPTGAGKTTMVNLLMKFYNINSGDIIIDGVSIKELSRNNIHKLFTMVLQDTWLFNGSIKENIAYNRKNISQEKIKEVCEIVGLDHFIKTLPNGYDTILTDNDSVSSGQRQLLTIARGMIEDSPFLILDEATSNVDTRTEELVASSMDKLTKGKTSFIIAHRLSTIKNADLILVMKDGNIIEQGNHDELINKNGFYAELYNSQFEL